MSVFQLASGCQSYDWGKIGLQSKAAQYAQTNPSFVLDDSKPYAELWMGTHASCPSYVQGTGETLLQAVKRNASALLGGRVLQRFGDDLPFLFKVLAVKKALSIQAHPDKMLAERLHKEKPDIYKDDNHKPEMAIALTPFRAFCGFLPVESIATYLSAVPELVALIGSTVAESFKAATSQSARTDDSIRAALKDLFSALMMADEGEVRAQVTNMVWRYERAGVKDVEVGVSDLVLELNGQYPGDIGIFCVFMLNLVELEPGQAIFLKADEPHAYINGDIMECMATSDNVVRAGLTPKLRDVATLTSMLTYTWGSASSQIMPPRPFRTTKHTILYDPPIDEFSVLMTRLQDDEKEHHDAIDGPSIMIVTEGVGSMAYQGETVDLDKDGLVYFIGAGTEVKFEGGRGGLTLFRAFVESP